MRLPLVIRRLASTRSRAGLTVVVLAIGIAASSAAAASAWDTLVRPLPYADPARLVSLFEMNAGRGWTDGPVSPANLTDLAKQSQTLEAVAFHAASRSRYAPGSEVIVRLADRVARTRVLDVSSNLFDVLGRGPRVGPGFSGETTSRGVVASDRFWRRELGARDDAVGAVIQIDGLAHTIAGIMPAGFFFPGPEVDLWRAMSISPQQARVRRARQWRAIARLRDARGAARLRAELGRLSNDLSAAYPAENSGLVFGAMRLDEWLLGERRKPMGLLAAAGLALLVIALVNAAGLARVDLTSRKRELALRYSLGESPRQTVTTLVIERATTCVVATLVAAPLTALTIRAAGEAFGPRWAPAELFHPGLVALCGGGVLLVSVLVTLHVARRILASSSRGAGAVMKVAGAERWPSTAVPAALSLILTVLAFASYRDFAQNASLPPDLSALRDTLAATVVVKGAGVDDARVVKYFAEAVPAVRTLPGVAAAGATALLPLHGSGWTSFVWLPGTEITNLEVRHREITPGYFGQATGNRMTAGRDLEERDGTPAAPGLLVNETFARQFLQGRPAVGQVVTYTDPLRAQRHWRIVGVVRDEPVEPGRGAVPMVLRPHALTSEETMTIVVRVADPRATTASIQKRLESLDPAAAVLSIEPLHRALQRPMDGRRALAVLGWLVAGLSIALAASGQFARTSLAVASIRREYAIRLALGAQLSRLLGRVVMRAIAPSLFGIAGGVALLMTGRSLMPVPLTPDLGDAVLGCAALAAASLAAGLPALVSIPTINPSRLLADSHDRF